MLELGADPDARQSGKRFGSKPIDAITGYDSEDTKGLKEEIRKVIKEHKAAEAEAEKKAAEKSEGGKGPQPKKDSVLGTVRRAVKGVRKKRGYRPVDNSAGAAGLLDERGVAAAGSKGVDDGHDEGGSREGDGTGVAKPNPEFKPTSELKETTGLLDGNKNETYL